MSFQKYDLRFSKNKIYFRQLNKLKIIFRTQIEELFVKL